MLRITTFAALVLAAAPALAGDQSVYPHSHDYAYTQPTYVGSKTVPFNYRPLGETYILRTQNYDEGATKPLNIRRPGRTSTPFGSPVTEIFVTSPHLN